MIFTYAEDGTIYPIRSEREVFHESPDEKLERIRINTETNEALNKEREQRVLQLKINRPDLYELRRQYILRDLQ